MPIKQMSTCWLIVINIQFHFSHIQPFGGDESDVGSPKQNHVSAESSNLSVDPQNGREQNVQPMEEQGNLKKGNENLIGSEMEPASVSPAGESHRSMGDILSSMDPGHPLPVSGTESGVGKALSKVTGYNSNTKRSTFWGRSNVSCLLLYFTELYIKCNGI